MGETTARSGDMRPAGNLPPAGSRVRALLTQLLLLLSGLVVAFPFYWMIASSLKGEQETMQVPPTLYPHQIVVSNYSQVWQSAPFGRYFLNTLLVAGLVTLGVLATSALAAHAFARMRFFGRQAIFIALLATLMVPFEVVLIPDYILVSKLGWGDTYTGLIVPWIASVFGIFLLRQFFLGLPDELWDAARLDGCGHLTFLARVALPLARSGLSVVAIVTFLGSWNSLLWPLVIVTRRPEIRPIQLGLAMFTSEFGTSFHLVMAAATLTVLPVLILFLIAQRQFVESIARTGVKG